MNAFFLAWRYLVHHRVRTIILIACLTITIYLPLAAQGVLTSSERHLLARAEGTPFVIGALGSRVDLVLNSLYFRARPPDTIAYGEVARVRDTDLAQSIPLLVRHTARGFPIVGTSLDYFSLRGLSIAAGKPLIRLGDCVLGANVAEALAIGPGDFLMSDPENVYDIAGAYPLNMRVMGVLTANGTPDDNAVFVDVKTAWVIEGLGHGHEDVTNVDDESVILERTEGEVVAGAALRQYTEITNENLNDFHVHGETASFPLTAVIALPADEKDAALLRGRYAVADATVQVIRPVAVVQEVMEMVFQAQRLFRLVLWLIVMSTGLFLVLVLLLTWRLRRQEMETMYRIGCGRLTMVRLQLCELAILGAASVALAIIASGATVWLAPNVVGRLLQ